MNTQTGSTQTSSAITGLKYFLVGSGIGAAAALLFAPKAGAAFRSDIKDATKKGYDGTLDLARRVKDQSADLYHSVLDGTAFGEAADAAEGGLLTAGNAISDAADKVTDNADDLLTIDDQPRSTSFGRKSTNIV